VQTERGKMKKTFKTELETLLQKYKKDVEACEDPGIFATYLCGCFTAFKATRGKLPF
jgi:hypothetical protein